MVFGGEILSQKKYTPIADSVSEVVDDDALNSI